jgi:hypothetical protein
MFTEQDIISIYTRQQAIEDGVLIDITAGFPNEIRDCGFKFHIAMTQAAFAEAVELTPKAEACGCDLYGRMFDVLNMLRVYARRNSESCILFEGRVVQNSRRPSIVWLKAMCHPGDNGEPVITISLPHED